MWVALDPPILAPGTVRAAFMTLSAVAWAARWAGLGEDAGVGVGGGDDARVTEHLLDDLQVRMRG
jgi:hypothetical protein